LKGVEADPKNVTTAAHGGHVMVRMGVRHALFPVLTFGALMAASFPTPFSTASGVAAS